MRLPCSKSFGSLARSRAASASAVNVNVRSFMNRSFYQGLAGKSHTRAVVSFMPEHPAMANTLTIAATEMGRADALHSEVMFMKIRSCYDRAEARLPRDWVSKLEEIPFNSIRTRHDGKL